MKQATPVSSSQSISLELNQTTFHGQSPDGSFRIIKNGKKAKLYGVAFELVTSKDGQDTLRKKRRKVGITPGYTPGAQGEQNFVAECSKTKRQYRLIGQLEYCTPLADAVKTYALEAKSSETEIIISTRAETVVVVPTQDLVLPMVIHAETSALTTAISRSHESGGNKKQAHADAQLRAFKRELEIIVAQRDVGIDPQVSIAAICQISSRARATIYRDLLKGILPPLTKIGRNSYLPYSVVEAYAAGRLCVGAA